VAIPRVRARIGTRVPFLNSELQGALCFENEFSDVVLRKKTLL
jgi:hypothetical protein